MITNNKKEQTNSAKHENLLKIFKEVQNENQNPNIQFVVDNNNQKSIKNSNKELNEIHFSDPTKNIQIQTDNDMCFEYSSNSISFTTMEKQNNQSNQPNQKLSYCPYNLNLNHKSKKNLISNIFKTKQNNKLKDYLLGIGPEYFLTYKKEDSLVSLQTDFLSKHNIDPIIRTKYVDWLIFTANYLNLSKETVFLSISILDDYFSVEAKHNNKVISEDFFLFAMTSVLIASKIEDVIPIQIEDLEKLLNNQFSL